MFTSTESCGWHLVCCLMWRTAANTVGSTFCVQASEFGLAAMAELVVERPATIFIGTANQFAGWMDVIVGSSKYPSSYGWRWKKKNKQKASVFQRKKKQKASVFLEKEEWHAGKQWKKPSAAEKWSAGACLCKSSARNVDSITVSSVAGMCN